MNRLPATSSGFAIVRDYREHKDLENLPSTLMICYLNGFDDAKQVLIDAKELLRKHPKVYASFKDSMRVLRKMKYNVNE